MFCHYAPPPPPGWLLQVLITLQKIGCPIGGIAVLYALLSTTLTGLLNPALYAAFSRSYRTGYLSVLKAVARRLCCCFYDTTDLKFLGACLKLSSDPAKANAKVTIFFDVYCLFAWCKSLLAIIARQVEWGVNMNL